MQLVNVSARDRRQLEMAADLLRQTFPSHLAWFNYVVSVLDGRSPSCGCNESTIACTLPTDDSKVLVGFHRRISGISVPELAETISHEGRHWIRHPYLSDQVLQVQHQCSDASCLQPWQRAMDPIYAEDERIRPVLIRYWAEHQAEIEAKHPAPAEFPWKKLAAAAAVAIALWGLGGK